MASWDDVFGDLDVRTLDHDERLDFINAEIERALAGKSWAALSAGEEGQLAWDAAIRTFLDGIWVATILCCHVVCEREVAGVISTSRVRLNGVLPRKWEALGLGGLLREAERFALLPHNLIDALHDLANARKPYGHWRSLVNEQSLFRRAQAEADLTGHTDHHNIVERLVVRDATNAMRTTIRLYFGSYGLGNPNLPATVSTTYRNPESPAGEP